jgi:ectoine hydroxylase-related dioxygenase (phytanoyl-CoA dioxygenase family)
MKAFLLEIDSLLSRYLLKVQSSFSVSIFEWLAYLGKTNHFPITRGGIQVSEAEAEALRSKLEGGLKRGSITSDFSKITDIDEDDPVIVRLLQKVEPYVRLRLGTSYKVTCKLLRNEHFDARFENSEVYSNRWHQDSDLGTRQIKAFLALHDVTLKDGPLTFLNRSATKKHWKTLGNRFSDASVFNPILSFYEEDRFEAKRGDYVIVNTARNLHRATIPATARDLIVVTFVPTRLPLKSAR